MSKFVAIRAEGVVAVHATDAGSNYETLCGLDGGDDSAGIEQAPVELPKRPKVNCKTCILIIEHAHTYLKRDITRGTHR